MRAEFTWIPFYMEFADKLYGYKERREELIDIIKNVYKNTEIKLPTLEKDGAVFDIDPFTVFGLFNKGISKANRIRIAEEFKRILSISAEVPSHFAGIPILNNLKATFYWFEDDRGEHDIDNLWEMFTSALDYAKDWSENNRGNFCKWYEIVVKQKGVRWNLSIGLYWIRPYTYLNLDSQNRYYLRNSLDLPDGLRKAFKEKAKSIPNANDYLTLCDMCLAEITSNDKEYDSFPSFSYYVWLSSKNSDGYIDKDKENQSSSKIEQPIEIDNKGKPNHYWLFSPGKNAIYWNKFYKDGIIAIGWDFIGDLKKIHDRDEIKTKFQEKYKDNGDHRNDTLALWEFAKVMKPGDMVFCKEGLNKIIGCGIVESDYLYDETRSTCKHIRSIKWTHNGIWEYPSQLVVKTLTDYTPYKKDVQQLKDLIGLMESEVITEPEFMPYNKNNFLTDVFITEQEYDKLCALLLRKKNIILQGAPGVGKTFSAKRLAYSIIGEKNMSRICMVQFHQSYSYEDFIFGYRPNEDGDFAPCSGVFYDFCEKCKNDTDNKYFFIIDEINRGNLSKIFGELLMLIETDKRGEDNKINLVYGGKQFYIPENLYIIGLMNTADRSLAMIDYALRRRFSFYTMKPAFDNADTNGFGDHIKDLDCPLYHSVIDKVKNMNLAIRKDTSLGKVFEIGHSYFIPAKNDVVNDEWVRGVVEYEIIPLIEEYWFDDDKTADRWISEFRQIIGENDDDR